jgi:PAS domain S-box-containing protein
VAILIDSQGTTHFALISLRKVRTFSMLAGCSQLEGSKMENQTQSRNDIINELLRLCRQLGELTTPEAQIIARGKDLLIPHQQSLDIIEFLPDATFVIDTESKVIAWNRALEEMTGLEKRQILGKGDYLYALPFYGEAKPILIDFVITGEADTRERYHFVERHGRDFYAETYASKLYAGKGAYLWGKASPLYDKDGNLTGAIESIRDITQRKQSEESLQASEKLFRMLVETMNEGLGLLDENGVIIYVNDKLGEILGYSKDELVGRTEAEFLDQANRASYEKETERRRRDKKTSCEIELLAKDGRRIPIIISVSPILDEKGNYKGAIETVNDITTRKQAEKKLRESEEKYRMIFENSPLGILHFNQDATITACNDTILRIWGSCREKLIGFNLFNSLKNKRMKAAVGACIAGKPACYEGNYLSITGGKITNLKADFGPILADDGSCLGGIGILEDVSERKLTEIVSEESL